MGLWPRVAVLALVRSPVSYDTKITGRGVLAWPRQERFLFPGRRYLGWQQPQDLYYDDHTFKLLPLLSTLSDCSLWLLTLPICCLSSCSFPSCRMTFSFSVSQFSRVGIFCSLYADMKKASMWFRLFASRDRFPGSISSSCTR